MADESWLRAHERYQRRRALAETTIRQRRSVLGAFRRGIAPTSLLSVTSDDIEDWLDSRSICADTRYSYISALASFYGFVVREGGLDVDPTTRVIRPRKRRGLPRPVPTDQLSLALLHAPNEMRAMLALAAFQGLRCKEIAGLRVEDLLWDHRPPMLIVSAPKGDRERIMALNVRTELALRDHGLRRAGFVFVQWGSDEPYTPAQVSRRIARHFRDLELGARAHNLRHWFGTQVFDRSRDLRVAQEVLGHADPSTTAVYTKFSRSRATDVVRDLTLMPGGSAWGDGRTLSPETAIPSALPPAGGL